ncbi:MAG: phosphatidate cytidylyltransferase [Acidobacteria bacterium]|nr:phosphatidate cytidylyltransferase [Acidobacteriota bacterium]
MNCLAPVEAKRNTGYRVVTSLILIPVITWVVLFAPPFLFVAAVCAFAALCWMEFAGIAAHYGARFGASAGWIPGLAFLLIQREEMLLLIAVVLAALAFSLRVDDLKDAIPSAGLFTLGILYTFGAWRSAIVLHNNSPYWLLFALTINWVGDTAAFYVGRAIGQHKLAPAVSPGKSWEGAIASALVAGVYGVFFLRYLLPEVPLPTAALLAIAGNTAGQIGDLAESALKRGAGVKDSGTTLPGHGGWLDRLDSSLFSMPVVHILIRLSQLPS